MRSRLVRLIAALVLGVAAPTLLTGCMPGTATVARSVAHHGDEAAEVAGARAVADTGELAAREAAEKAAREETDRLAAGQPLGRGHTGRHTPETLAEKLALDEVISNPAAGRTVIATIGDTNRWPEDGWAKKARNVEGKEIHYLFDERTGAIDDVKFIN